MKPVIGITGNRHTFALKIPGPVLTGVNSADDYAHGVENAGGLPVVLPFLEREETVRELAGRLDGLLLAGGEDVSHLLYGQQPRVGLGEVIPERDALEIALLRAMMELGKPVLGVCRGVQLLNVALGGSLYQDLPREWRGTTLHSQRARRNHLSHTIQIEPNSRLYGLLGQYAKLDCNSYHHQAIDRVAESLIAVAWDEDGLIEAVERPGPEFVVGVQWHPENLWRTYPVYLGLFQGLVEAAKA